MLFRGFVWLSALTLWLSLASLEAQVVTGAIIGRVTDTTGAVVPGATIQVQNVETGFSRTLQTDPEGRYGARNLPLGSYAITVQQTGFRTAVRRGIVLTVASEVVVNTELAVGAVQETVEVTAEAPTIELTNATLSEMVNQNQIRDLPLNGRNIDSLALLVPGVFQNRAVSNIPIGGMGMRLSINGGRPDSNLFLLDGTVVNDHALNGPNSASGGNLGVEGVLEYRVLTHNFSAEYGQGSGGVLSMVTRSGTNAFHGSVYEFVRNNVFDARDFFNPGELPAYRRNQFGAALGGPLVRDRIFFFANYEGLRRRQGVSVVTSVPDANARLGLVPVLADGSCPPRTIQATGGLCQATLNPAMVPFLRLYPLPNGRNYRDGTAEYIEDAGTSATEDYSMERMDFRLSDNDSFYWRYVYNPAESSEPREIPTFRNDTRTTSHFVVLSETHIFSGSTLNEFRFGFNRSAPIESHPLPPEAAGLEFVPGQGFGQIDVSGGSPGAAGAQLGDLGSARAGQFFVSNLFQATDTFSTTRGAHALKFGATLARSQLNTEWGTRRGDYTFEGLLEVLAGTPTRLRVQLPRPGDTLQRGWRRTMFGWFVQDDFRVSPNLTLNLGLRHEFFTDPTEVQGRLGNLIHTTDAEMTPGNLFEGRKANISPRFGLAWDPTGSGKTAVRLGAGMFFNPIDGRSYWRAGAVNPDYQVDLRINNPPFPNGFARGFTVGSQITSGFESPLDTPTVIHYNVEVQREVAPMLSVRASYVGSYGYNLLRTTDENLRIPTIVDGRKFYVSSAPKPNPRFSTIERIVSDARSNYNAFQLAVQKSVSAGTRLGLSYTYSKALSNADQVINSSTSNVTTSFAQDPQYLDGDYSLSAFDQRHTLVLNGSYAMPWDRWLNANSGVAKAILGGWSANGIYSYGSGLPFGIRLGFQNSRSGAGSTTDRPNLVAGFSNNPIEGVTAGCQGIPVPVGQKLGTPELWYDPCAFELAPVGYFGNLGRNTVTSPGTNKVDFTLVKTTAITEQKRVEFRAEFFNLFNRAHFAPPVLALFTSSRLHSGNEGRITQTASSNREIQLGMKFIF